MSDNQASTKKRSSNDPQRWRIGIVSLTLLLLLGGVIYFISPSQLQRDVEKAGGTFTVHAIKRTPIQVLSDLLNGGTRQQPFHVIEFDKVPVDDNWLRDHQTALSDAAHLSLTLVDTQVTDAGIVELRDMKSLHSITLQGKQITDASLPELVTLSNVASLQLGNTSISGKGLSQLIAMKNLAALVIDGDQATNGGMAALKPMPKLQSLYVTQSTNESIAAVADSPNKQIYFLSMKGDEVTDESLTELSTLQMLKYLTLIDTQLSEAAITALKTALPECEIQVLTTEQIEAAIAEYDGQ